MTEGGSEALENTRHEAMAGLLSEGVSQVRAYCLTAPGGPAEETAGRQVSSSRLLSRHPEILERVAFLKRERAENEAPDAVSREYISDLMEKTTERLSSIAEYARAIGEDSLTTRINRILTVSAGRSRRLHEKVGHFEKRVGNWPIQMIPICECD